MLNTVINDLSAVTSLIEASTLIQEETKQSLYSQLSVYTAFVADVERGVRPDSSADTQEMLGCIQEFCATVSADLAPQGVTANEHA